MPVNRVQENPGRMVNFKNKSKDMEVSLVARSLNTLLATSGCTILLKYECVHSQDMRRRRNDASVELRRVSES